LIQSWSTSRVERTDVTPEFIRTTIVAATRELSALGFDVRSCLINDEDAAEAQVLAQLASGPIDIIMIGAGLRARVEHTVLFEQVVNLLHTAAPSARFCFNTNRPIR
jgi:hypothetical protein